MRSKIGWILGAAALFVMLGGCGKGTPPPALPMPPPPPQTNPYGGGIGAVNCGAVNSQYPFSQTPFLGSMAGGNSIQLTLGYSGFPSGASALQNVVGSAMLNLPTVLQTQNPYAPQQQQQQQYQFCVTSVPTSGGQPFPGTYAAGDRSIAIVLYGFVQAPVYQYNPYDPYSNNMQGGTQFSQLPATVSIGQSITPNYSGYDDCGAYLIDGRVRGCVEVKLGNYSQAKRLYFQ
jgi:hypothetical protein